MIASERSMTVWFSSHFYRKLCMEPCCSLQAKSVQVIKQFCFQQQNLNVDAEIVWGNWDHDFVLFNTPTINPNPCIPVIDILPNTVFEQTAGHVKWSELPHSMRALPHLPHLNYHHRYLSPSLALYHTNANHQYTDNDELHQNMKCPYKLIGFCTAW